MLDCKEKMKFNVTMSARSSEEVLLIVYHVRNKKTDGTLYLMGERMAWMQGTQKISPDSKEKVQLQLVMHDGSANTFHFNNPKGRENAIQDRDSVKELLQQLLPKFRNKISSELEMKNKMLQENPEVFQLYKDLVKVSNSSNGKPDVGKQPVGVSAAFLAEVKPQTDGCNGLKYNLTADIIESIFRTYPMVKKKHAEYVPHQMTESEFWTRFFQSHYFHRDRMNIGTKDVFSDCAKNDDQEIREEITKNVSDPLLDLTQIKDSSLDEGFRGVTEDNRTTNNQTNLTMIRRFNHHSTMVLKSCDSDKSKNSSSSSTSNGSISGDSNEVVNGHTSHVKVNGKTNSSFKSDSSSSSCEPVAKKAKIREKLKMEDLQESTNSKNVNLRLTKMEGYLHGPTPVMATRYTTSEDVINAASSVSEEISHWSPDLTQVLSGQAAVSVLGELSPGGLLMHGTSAHQLNQMIPSSIQDELKALYNALLELLRHFWNCFPVTTSFLEEKNPEWYH
ncbi:hypothetical protein KUTeg_023313 [Tegillarca granosa]|uniref:BSD domain-containing protein n=1 Tax=Tegillarca granosa TaxID=220873 RepID=A0ABQ9E1C5_TEGGR|nr:hypothetical protein KUTeg_023313 [Tegillarca granosa]